MRRRFEPQVVRQGEWERKGKYVMGYSVLEQHGDSARHPTKTHAVVRLRCLKEKFKAEQQLKRIAAQREARNEKGNPVVNKAVHGGAQVEATPPEHGDRQVDVRGDQQRR